MNAISMSTSFISQLIHEKYSKVLLIGGIVLSIALLIPTLFFPISNDHSIYLRGGEVILNGGTLYKDYLDLKPPLIYYVFAVIRFIFGSGEYAIRYGDFLYQSCTIILLCLVVRKRSGDDAIAVTSSILFALSYSTMGFPVVMNCEALSYPFMVGIVYYLTDEKLAWKHALFAGICCGIIAAFKYTLLILVLASIFYIFISDKKQAHSRMLLTLILGVGSLMGFALGSFPLLINSEMRSSFTLMLQYIQYYNSISPLNLELIKTAIKANGIYFGDTYSLLLTICATSTAVLYLQQDDFRRRFIHLFTIAVFSIIFLLLSVDVERKFIPTHYSRMLPFLTILSSAGMISIIRLAYTMYPIVTDENRRVKRIGLFILVVLWSIFSPIPRYVNVSIPLVYFFVAPDKFLKNYDREDVSSLNFEERKRVIDYLKNSRNPSEKSLIISIGNAQIATLINESPWSAFSHSQFCFSNGVPNVWKQRFYDEVHIADWIVVSIDDQFTSLNGHSRTSWESLQADTTIFPYFTQHFDRVLTTESMYIFHRKK